MPAQGLGKVLEGVRSSGSIQGSIGAPPANSGLGNALSGVAGKAPAAGIGNVVSGMNQPAGIAKVVSGVKK